MKLKLKTTEEDNGILCFLLAKLKSIVVERVPLLGVNLMNYNLEYVKIAIIASPEIS
jgi:hypothetical protein